MERAPGRYYEGIGYRMGTHPKIIEDSIHSARSRGVVGRYVADIVNDGYSTPEHEYLAADALDVLASLIEDELIDSSSYLAIVVDTSTITEVPFTTKTKVTFA